MILLGLVAATLFVQSSPGQDAPASPTTGIDKPVLVESKQQRLNGISQLYRAHLLTYVEFRRLRAALIDQDEATLNQPLKKRWIALTKIEF